MKKTIFMFSILLSFLAFAKNAEEKIVAHITLKSDAKNHEVSTYSFVKTIDLKKNEIFQLKLMNSKKMIKEKNVNNTDANIFIAQMNDMIWDFEYKRKNQNSKVCTPVILLEVGPSQTKICGNERIKISKIQGMIRHLESMLK